MHLKVKRFLPSILNLTNNNGDRDGDHDVDDDDDDNGCANEINHDDVDDVVGRAQDVGI